MNMVERVARALCIQDNKDPDDMLNPPMDIAVVRDDIAPRPKVPQWKNFVAPALVALREIRTPTPTMLVEAEERLKIDRTTIADVWDVMTYAAQRRERPLAP
jgi:hypothetical protein